MALTVTVSGETSESYVSVAEADAYFDAHYALAKQTVWAGFTDAQKEHLLKTAVHVIETLPMEDSAVFRHVYNQRLTFPRNIDVVSSGDWEIPQVVKDAQCEQAVYMATLDESVIASQMQGVREEEIGGDINLRTQMSGQTSLLAPMAFHFMQPYLRRGGNGGRLRRA